MGQPQQQPYWPSHMEDRWVIVPLDLAQSFGVICVHYHHRVIHRAIIYMRAQFKSTQEGQLTLNGILLICEQIRRYNNSPTYVTARWAPKQIPPLNFIGCLWVVFSNKQLFWEPPAGTRYTCLNQHWQQLVRGNHTYWFFANLNLISKITTIPHTTDV